MGAAALLRVGRSHRQLPLSDIKDRGARHPLFEGCRAPSYIRMSALEASAATSGALGLSALAV